MIDPTTTREFANEGDNTTLHGTRIFDRAFAASSALPARAARAVVAFALDAGFGRPCRARIGSALADIVDNAVRRGYPAGAGVIRIQAEVRGT
jgi:hypothetical protein